jgi:hypothetical protein
MKNWMPPPMRIAHFLALHRPAITRFSMRGTQK